MLSVSSLRYKIENDKAQQKPTWRSWNFVHFLFYKIGEKLRNGFYLPLYSKKVSKAYILDQKLAHKVSSLLRIGGNECTKNETLINSYFSIYDLHVTLEGAFSRTFIVRVFESKVPVNNKKLRLFLFSFYGNKEILSNSLQKSWDPCSIKDLSEGPVKVLQALKNYGYSMDSMVTTSLGNIALCGFKRLTEPNIFPSTLIINRGLTSVRKVTLKLYSHIIGSLFWLMAQLLGWDADPEKDLLKFFKKESKKENVPARRIAIIETRRDTYFSGEGKFDSNFTEKIAKYGIKVFRGNYFPFPYHERAHHAASFNDLKNNNLTKIKVNDFLDIKPNEKLSTTISRDVFHTGNKEWHQCLYVLGNDGTLDVGTARDVYPLLKEFIILKEKIS